MSSDAVDQPNSSSQEQHPSHGLLIVVSSPSGGGKGTLILRALKMVPGLRYSVSYTTRSPRRGEVDGEDYWFVSLDKFASMISEGEFLEWAVVHGNHYGTARSQVAREVAMGHDIILEIDVQGAATVRALGLNTVEVFILPPSFEILRQRLIDRQSDNLSDVQVRLGNAKGEVEHFRSFDYVIINDDAEAAASRLASIVVAMRSRTERMRICAERVLETFP